MDGKRRAFDNIFIERLWRSIKYEEIYLHDHANAVEAKKGFQLISSITITKDNINL